MYFAPFPFALLILSFLLALSSQQMDAWWDIVYERKKEENKKDSNTDESSIELTVVSIRPEGWIPYTCRFLALSISIILLARNVKALALSC